ncbi:hypothetical protein [Terrihabitans soli]|nr:hypothetical protein [Terrihabitans soli]
MRTAVGFAAVIALVALPPLLIRYVWYGLLFPPPAQPLRITWTYPHVTDKMLLLAILAGVIAMPALWHAVSLFAYLSGDSVSWMSFGPRPATRDAALLQFVPWAIFSIGCAAIAHRMAHTRIEFSEDGVAFTKALGRKTRVPWSDVTEINLRDFTSPVIFYSGFRRHELSAHFPGFEHFIGYAEGRGVRVVQSKDEDTRAHRRGQMRRGAVYALPAVVVILLIGWHVYNGTPLPSSPPEEPATSGDWRTPCRTGWCVPAERMPLN